MDTETSTPIETATTFPMDRYGLVRRKDATKAGYSDNQLVDAVARGELSRLARGVFLPVASLRHLDDPTAPDSAAVRAQEKYRLTCIASATTSTNSGAPLSHQSAAAVHGIVLLKPDRSRVHVATKRGGGGSIRSSRHLHPGPLTDDDIVEVNGIAATSLARTAVDIARSSSFAQALTVFDGVLRAGVERGELEERLRGGTRGIRIARRALLYANRASESVGESWSRAQMIEAALPLPRLQHTFFIAGNEYRSDFDWDEKLVGEFDGRIKYGRLLKPGQDVSSAVMEEKRREDEFRSTGSMVIRWDWSVLERRTLAGLLVPWLRKLGLLT